ncbi:HNH endonuclease [Mycobacterium yunnanensis]|uniref:HNH endonuclease n=1 Tax=Mycobacterium yunnanensis TaxID=368477 RepID=UPI0021F2EB98|nr:HNH endonuclease [Mycobacterium yunnanensis]
MPVILVGDGERFLDEVVATAFLGPAPAPIRGVTVLHFDGDPFNCRVDNLRWMIDPEWDALRTEHEMQFNMQPANRKQPKQRVVFFR